MSLVPAAADQCPHTSTTHTVSYPLADVLLDTFCALTHSLSVQLVHLELLSTGWARSPKEEPLKMIRE